MNTSSFFEFYYNHAKLNSILVMDGDGVVVNVNKAFTNNFGYDNEEIRGRHFSVLFSQRDRETNKPQIELETVLATGQAQDENYVMNKAGRAVWVTGESLLVYGEEGEKYIVKDIVNLQTKKQLQLLLGQSEELLERMFDAGEGLAVMVLDGGMKILKVNTAFLSLFEMAEAPPRGSGLSELDHSFWHETEVRQAIRDVIVTNRPGIQQELLLQTRSGEMKMLRMDAKIIDGVTGEGRKIYILLEDRAPQTEPQ